MTKMPTLVTAEPGLFSQRLRYARPGEMCEAHLEAERVRAANPGEIVVDVQPA